jgi:hypothetical protein
MAKTVKPEDLGAAIAQELEIYHADVIKRVNQCSEDAVKTLVKKTKATAPKKSGAFRKSIAGKLLQEGSRGNKYVWYVKAPHYRLTHLLVHGHAKQNGGRVPGDPFLADALNEVLPEYENAVTEAVKNG